MACHQLIVCLSSVSRASAMVPFRISAQWVRSNRKRRRLFLSEGQRAGGRIEERRYWLVSEIAWLAETRAWPGVRSVGLVEAQRSMDEVTTVERRYYLTSLAGDVQQFAH